MKFNLSLIFAFFIPVVALADQSGKRLNCTGNVTVIEETSKYETHVGLSMLEPKVGSRISLWHPITSDFEAGVSLTVVGIRETIDGTEVWSLYDGHSFEFDEWQISFKITKNEKDQIILKEFQGFEELPFGPSNLICQ